MHLVFGAGGGARVGTALHLTLLSPGFEPGRAVQPSRLRGFRGFLFAGVFTRVFIYIPRPPHPTPSPGLSWPVVGCRVIVVIVIVTMEVGFHRTALRLDFSPPSSVRIRLT